MCLHEIVTLSKNNLTLFVETVSLGDPSGSPAGYRWIEMDKTQGIISLGYNVSGTTMIQQADSIPIGFLNATTEYSAGRQIANISIQNGLHSDLTNCRATVLVSKENTTNYAVDFGQIVDIHALDDSYFIEISFNIAAKTNVNLIVKPEGL